jgi:hypothetical protein
MTDVPSPSGSQDLSFSVRLSAEPAFAETAGALAARAGDFSGCPADDARRLGEAVREAFSRLATTATIADEVELVVHGTPRIVRIDLCCAQASATPDLEARIASLEHGEPIRALVDRIEFGKEGGACYCRFTQQVRPTR